MRSLYTKYTEYQDVLGCIFTDAPDGWSYGSLGVGTCST